MEIRMIQAKENTVHLGNVLSVFDGMGCGRVALERAGISYDNYYASEIDKYAIKVATKNYPNTIELGTIVDWKNWNLPRIDLFIGGSPCQGFSNAGLGLNFDDLRSKLFFTYVDILFYLIDKNPKLVFLLENVKMKKEWRNIISDKMGMEPIEINSALVSAQNRKRLYWTNIPNIQQPEDRCIFLKDIIEDGEVDREKSYAVDANYYKGGNPRSYFEDAKRQLVFEHQSQKQALYLSEKEIEEMKIKKGAKTFSSGKSEGTIQFPFTLDRKSQCLLSNGITGSHRTTNVLDDGVGYRKLTVLECERLQTLCDGYTEGVSNTQRYKMIGNGWTVEVIAHIFRNIQVAESIDT
jgi:DNA-cytosine methyltransferase